MAKYLFSIRMNFNKRERRTFGTDALRIVRKSISLSQEKKTKQQNVPGPRDNVEACRLASDLALERTVGRCDGPRWLADDGGFPESGPSRSSRQELSMLLVFRSCELIVVGSELPFSSSSGQNDVCCAYKSRLWSRNFLFKDDYSALSQ